MPSEATLCVKAVMGVTLGEVINVPCHVGVPLLLDDELLLLLDDELLLLLPPPPPPQAVIRAAIKINDRTPFIFFMIFRFSFQPKSYNVKNVFSLILLSFFVKTFNGVSFFAIFPTFIASLYSTTLLQLFGGIAYDVLSPHF